MPAALLQGVPKQPLQFKFYIIQNTTVTEIVSVLYTFCMLLPILAAKCSYVQLNYAKIKKGIFCASVPLNQGCPNMYGKWPQPLLWDGSRTSS